MLDGAFFHNGATSLIIHGFSTSCVFGLPSSSVSPSIGSFTFFVPNCIGTDMNLQYLLSSWRILLSSRKSAQSSEMYNMTSVPLSPLSIGLISYSGEPSHSHITPFSSAFCLNDLVLSATFDDTMKVE